MWVQYKRNIRILQLTGLEFWYLCWYMCF